MAYTQTGIRETREKKMSKVTPKKSKLETGYKIDLWLCNFGLLRICAHWHWRTKVKWNDVKISYFFFGRHRRRWRCFRRGRWYFVTLVSRRLKAQNDCDIYTFWVTIAIKRCEFPNDYYIYVIDIEFHASRGNNEASNMKCRRYKCQYTHSIWFVCRCLLLIFFSLSFWCFHVLCFHARHTRPKTIDYNCLFFSVFSSSLSLSIR